MVSCLRSPTITAAPEARYAVLPAWRARASRRAEPARAWAATDAPLERRPGLAVAEHPGPVGESCEVRGWSRLSCVKDRYGEAGTGPKVMQAMPGSHGIRNTYATRASFRSDLAPGPDRPDRASVRNPPVLHTWADSSAMLRDGGFRYGKAVARRRVRHRSQPGQPPFRRAVARAAVRPGAGCPYPPTAPSPPRSAEHTEGAL